MLFDGLLYENRPKLPLRPLHILYNTTAPEAIRHAASVASSGGCPLVLDIECWPTDARRPDVGRLIAAQSMAKLKTALAIVRDAAPGLRVGLYGILPQGDYWTPVNFHRAEALKEGNVWWAGNAYRFGEAYRAWKELNAALRHLSLSVDFVCPSLYVFYHDDPQGLEWYARENITEARQYCREVIPFLWPQIHNSNTAGWAEKPVPMDQWKGLCRLVASYCDSAVVWGGFKTPWTLDIADRVEAAREIIR